VAGYAGLLWIALAPVLAHRAGRPLLGATLLTAGTVWGADLITLVLKMTLERRRPYETLAEADPLLRASVGNSLPSGHAATSFAGAIILGYLFRRALPGLLALAALVAVSRVYVGVHYPSDVLVGAALGSMVALTVVAALRFRPRTSGAQRRSEAEPPAG
jgi:membrane-associated phospholipid phosphatase